MSDRRRIETDLDYRLGVVERGREVARLAWLREFDDLCDRATPDQQAALLEVETDRLGCDPDELRERGVPPASGEAREWAEQQIERLEQKRVERRDGYVSRRYGEGR